MQSDVPLDYAIFQLSPRRSRCELFVSYDGTTEKLASGLVKPFVTHLKVAEEQVALSGKSIKLDVEGYENAETWFTKGTLERFVRFVSTPEVLEMVSTYDAEMSQLEAARKIYSQGASECESNTSGGVGNGATVASDATKKELLRAIDTRLSAVKQDLTTACSRASTAGFNNKTVSELQFFANHFGAHRLSEACSKFITLTEQRSDLFNSNDTTSTWKLSSDSALRSSVGSDMSLDGPFDDQPKPTKVTIPSRRFSREPSPSPGPGPSPIDDLNEIENNKNDKDFDNDKAMGTTSATTSTTESISTSSGKPQLTRRLSVQERISLFENKAQTSPSTSTTPTSSGGKPEFRRLPSEINSSTEKAVLRRWSGASDMSIDISGDRKDPDSNANTPTPSSASSSFPVFPPRSKDPSDQKSEEGSKDFSLPAKPKFPPQVTVPAGVGSRVNESVLPESNSKIPSFTRRSSETDQSNYSGVESRTEEFGSPIPSITEENLERFSGEGGKPQGEFLAEVGQGGAKDFKSSKNQTESHSMQAENFDLVRGKSQEYSLGSDQVMRPGAKKECGFSFKSVEKNLTENMEGFSSTSLIPIDQGQRVRQAKGSQGVNDDLKMKANELEKLFAEHKLRVPGDQSNSARRIRPAEVTKEQEKGTSLALPNTTMLECEPDKGSSEMDKLNSTPSSKTYDNYNCDVTPKHKIYSLSFSDDSRGKLYQKYMEKRDAKLREDWSSNRTDKDAQMKAMQDSLEKSRAEMKVKLAASASNTRQRAEKMRSLNARSARKRDQPADPFMSDEDEVQAEFRGKKLTEYGDSSSKSAQSKRVQPNKNTSSPSPRNPTGSIPRYSGKASNSATGRRRLPYDNPLTQSVPNFSDLRKENTRPSPGGSKPVRPQGRNHARKKSTSEDFPLVNEEKPRRSQFPKRNTANPKELNDYQNSDDVDDAQFMPSKFHKEENDDYEQISNDSVSKVPPRKAISKDSVTGETARNGYNFVDTTFGTNEMMAVAKAEEHDNDTTIVDSSQGRLSHESDKSEISGYENNNALRFVSQAGPYSAAELPITMPSLFRSMGSTLDSPEDSPGSWNSRLQNSFAFSHEISDIDASYSPTESPASWNFQTLSQSEAEAARMRKKWGAAQKPVAAIDSSNSPSRKDVTKSLKRFLKFGRRNRASENLADWISATTSEGDDSEDGRDVIYRSSEDLRKSRMGFSQSHNSDEGFNGNDLFNEQVHSLRSSIPTPPQNFKLREEHLSGSSMKAPKSFFSLANFRSKANDSKPR